jgi:glycosyltransferase involved in cell wall biosynthesis
VIWSILIASLARRRDLLGQLISGLAQQQVPPEVEIVCYRNHGEKWLGEIRQALVTEARGEYISFIDDDDQVSEHYISTILPLLDGVDYVGWRMQAYVDGQPLKPTYHSLEYGAWTEEPFCYRRDVSHLNPVRRELALKADFSRADPPEDVAWSDQMRPFVKTQNHCGEQIMYHYYARSSDSAWRPLHEGQWNGFDDLLTQPVAHQFDHIPTFRWHKDST